MRIPPSSKKRLKNPKYRSATDVSERNFHAARPPAVSDDHAAIKARVAESEFGNGFTAGGRKPSYKTDYAALAKAMCERGATLNELAEEIGVSIKAILHWQLTQPGFLEACALSPACVERGRRSMFESSLQQFVTTEKIVESGSQRQITKTTTTLPANLGFTKSFVIDEAVETVGEFQQLLDQMKANYETRSAQPRYRGPDGKMMSSKEHVALGGSFDGGEINWKTKSADEIRASQRKLLEMRQKP